MRRTLTICMFVFVCLCISMPQAHAKKLIEKVRSQGAVFVKVLDDNTVRINVEPMTGKRYSGECELRVSGRTIKKWAKGPYDMTCGVEVFPIDDAKVSIPLAGYTRVFEAYFKTLDDKGRSGREDWAAPATTMDFTYEEEVRPIGDVGTSAANRSIPADSVIFSRADALKIRQDIEKLQARLAELENVEAELKITKALLAEREAQIESLRAADKVKLIAEVQQNARIEAPTAPRILVKLDNQVVEDNSTITIDRARQLVVQGPEGTTKIMLCVYGPDGKAMTYTNKAGERKSYPAFSSIESVKLAIGPTGYTGTQKWIFEVFKEGESEPTARITFNLKFQGVK